MREEICRLGSFAALFMAAACGAVPGKNPDGGMSDAAENHDAHEVDAAPVACTETTCTDDVLEVCGTNGLVERTEQCALGCADTSPRCYALDPSNSLASRLDEAPLQNDVTLPDGSTINTDSGAVMSPNGAVAVLTATVAQSGGPSLRVLVAKSWTLDNVRVTGSMPLALIASGEIVVRGVLDVSADRSTPGSGALACTTSTGMGGVPGSGYYERPRAGSSAGYPGYIWSINGAGGGGFGTVGGAGGVENADLAVGAPGVANGQATLVPLRGGCAGYGALAGYGGAGGGAIQLVSATKVRLLDGGSRKGIIHVGGGAGRAGTLGKDDLNDTTPMSGSGGGGAGGGILLEAPSVELDDGTALLAAGGGGGGYGACTPAPDGTDAPSGIGTPAGGACPGGTSPTSVGGDGATNTTGNAGGDTTKGGSAGGGGGGLGRIRVNTANGQYTQGTGTIIRGSATTGTAAKR